MKKTLLVFVILACALTGSLFAMPFLYQGNIKVPMAYILPHRMVEATYVSYVTAYEGMDYEYDFGTVVSAGLFDRAEAAFIATGSGALAFNVKLNLVSETTYLPATSFGVDNLLSDVTDTRTQSLTAPMGDMEYTDPEDFIENSYYLTMSKSFDFSGMNAKLHWGLGTGRFKGDTEISEQLSGLFVGVEYSPISLVSLIGEYEADHYNAGISLNLGKFRAAIAAHRFDEVDSNQDLKFAVSLRYVFDDFATNNYSGRISASEHAGTLGDFYIRQDRAENAQIIEEIRKMREKREKIDQQSDEIERMLQENADQR